MSLNRYKYIDTDGAHLHTLDGKPLLGASTVTKIIGKGDGLVQWSANCAVECVDDAFIDHMGTLTIKLEDWEIVLEQAKTAWKTKRDKSAEKGSERHGELEKYVKACLQYSEGKPSPGPVETDKSIKAFVDWAWSNVDHFSFTEANCYNEDLWVGGIADIGMVLKDGRRVVGDHKSSKEAYLSQFIQTALYDLLLSHSGGLDAEGNKHFDWKPADGYVVFPFRSSPFTPEFRWNAEDMREGARSAVRLYKLDNN